MKIAKRKNRRHLIPIAISLICVAVFFSMLFFTYIRKMDRTLTEENRARLSEVSAHVSSYMQILLEEQWRSMETAASSLAFLPDDASRLTLLEQFSDNLGFEYIGIAGRNGILRARDFPDPRDISTEEYFQRALDGEPVITGMTRTLFRDHAVSGVIFAYPIPDGAVVAMVNISELGAPVQMHSFDGQGYSYLIDREGNLILHARSMQYHNFFQSMMNVEFADGYSLEKLKSDISADQEGLTSYSELGTDKYAYYRPMGVNGWTVVSTVPKGVITRRTAMLSRDLIIICAVTMLFFLVLLILICVQLLQLESRRRANQTRSAFFANMSHDMRTPLNAILGMAAIADARAGEPDTVRDCIQKISGSSRHLLGLINDILDMSKIENSRLTLNQYRLSLADIMESSVNMVYPSMRNKRQHFSVLLKNLRHEFFLGDTLRLTQIFVNILSNAMKFTPEEGHITVLIEELLPWKPGTAVIRLYFTDDGIGMPAEFLKSLFTPFTRAQDSKVDKIEGSGLGMSITKHILDLMGGTIQAASGLGKGTTFTVTLPLPIIETEKEKLPDCRVLVVNSEPDQAMETAQTLKALGVQADLAPDVTALPDIIRTALESGSPYRIALLDQNACVPGVLSLCRKQDTNMPVFVLCAYGWEEIPASIRGAGFRHYASNPLFPSTLSRCIAEALNVADNTVQRLRFDFSGWRILIAEDNELNREIVESLLCQFNAGVTAVTNGLECVREFLSSPENWFDLILMDIQMPVMNGNDACRQIRAAARQDASLPILAMSANAFEEDIAAAKAAGMDEYLTKPIDVDVWMTAITKAMSR